MPSAVPPRRGRRVLEGAPIRPNPAADLAGKPEAPAGKPDAPAPGGDYSRPIASSAKPADKREQRQKLALIRDDERFLTENMQPDTIAEFQRLYENSPGLWKKGSAAPAPEKPRFNFRPALVALFNVVFGFVALGLVRRGVIGAHQAPAWQLDDEQTERLCKSTDECVSHYAGKYIRDLPPWAGLTGDVMTTSLEMAQRGAAMPAPPQVRAPGEVIKPRDWGSSASAAHAPQP